MRVKQQAMIQVFDHLVNKYDIPPRMLRRWARQAFGGCTLKFRFPVSSHPQFKMMDKTFNQFTGLTTSQQMKIAKWVHALMAHSDGNKWHEDMRVVVCQREVAGAVVLGENGRPRVIYVID